MQPAISTVAYCLLCNNIKDDFKKEKKIYTDKYFDRHLTNLNWVDPITVNSLICWIKQNMLSTYKIRNSLANLVSSSGIGVAGGNVHWSGSHSLICPLFITLFIYLVHVTIVLRRQLVEPNVRWCHLPEVNWKTKEFILSDRISP